jgi:hypothetical protein
MTDNADIQRIANRNTETIVTDGEGEGTVSVSHNYGPQTELTSVQALEGGVFIEIIEFEPFLPDGTVFLGISPRMARKLALALNAVASEVDARVAVTRIEARG